MRKALVVGINYYEAGPSLYGCVDDAHSVKAVIERHGDTSINFDVRLLTGTGPTDQVTRRDLKDAVTDLFADDDNSDASLFYFAGHGHIDETGGYLCTSEVKDGDEGLSLSDILRIAAKSPIKNRIVILDSCHSGIAAARPTDPDTSELSDGMTILTASTAKQYATEGEAGGIFTSLLVDALEGSACNLLGQITPGSVYAHIDQSLGGWDLQRPVFKTNVKSFVSLRNVSPPISLSELKRITTLFPTKGFEFKLDPSFEPERPIEAAHTPDPINTEQFAVLQKYNRVNLVVPVDADHMYHAAMGSKSCRLTALGEHYRQLVERNKI